MDLSNIPSELLDKAKACKTSDELTELIETEGIELSDEQLDGMAGGAAWDNERCSDECVSDGCSIYGLKR